MDPRSRISLLGGDDVVGHSTYFVVCTRYGDFSPGHSTDGEPAVGFRHLSWRARLWVRLMCGEFVSPSPRLVLESSVLLVAFYGVLLFAAGQETAVFGSPYEFDAIGSSRPKRGAVT